VEHARVADIAIDPRSGGAEALYTYRVDADCAVGDAFFVPLGTRWALGFAVAVYDATEESLGFPLSSLREVQSRVDNLSLPGPLVELAKFVADEYLCSVPVALTASTPPGIRDRLATVWSLSDAESAGKDLFGGADFLQEVPLTPAQKEVLRTLADSGGSLLEMPSKHLPAAQLKTLKLLRSKGMVSQSLRLVPYREKKSETALLQLVDDPKKVEAFIAGEGKKKPAQVLTVMRLQAAGEGHATGFTPAEIKAMAGVTDATIRALKEAGLISAVSARSERLTMPPQLNPYQQLSADAISDSVGSAEDKAFLLFGVTGSGKTEVYLRAVAEALKLGRQVIYLVPEIALAAQAISLLRERFGRRVTVLHSDLAPSERLQNWLSIRDGSSPIVLGARSALFAPVANLGLIIIDEEHELSYKQESTPRYHAKRLAQFLAAKHSCPLVLGSATPSVESFFEAEQNESGHTGLTLLSLPERAASAKLPTVHIEDLTVGYKVGSPSIFSDDLRLRMNATLEQGHQAILFLNRRAYAPFIVCRDCGHQMLCPNCSVSLSFHRREGKLRCHYCGYNTRPVDLCPNCGGSRLSPFGVGTQKVEDQVASEFPLARVGRLDRDVAQRKGMLEATLASFRAGDLNVLVGTQMVAKGLDFPNVTLVGVIAADISLNLPDFRSGERTFQLLSQVAGRAGRSRFPGEVVIQTFNPDHRAVRTAQAHDYLGFYESARRERELAGYPPYRRLINLVFSGEGRVKVVEVADEAALRLRAAGLEGLDLLGPVDCAIERVQNRWRRHLLLKLPRGAVASSVALALESLATADVRLEIDVDPYSLM